MAAPSGESATTVHSLYMVNYRLLVVMLLKQPNGQLLVAVDHYELSTMASVSVKLIFTGRYPHHLQGSAPQAPLALCKCALQIGGIRSRGLQNTSPPHCLCGYSVVHYLLSYYHKITYARFCSLPNYNYDGDTLCFLRPSFAHSTLNKLDGWSADYIMASHTENELRSMYTQLRL